jgi:hypothetical protein
MSNSVLVCSSTSHQINPTRNILIDKEPNLNNSREKPIIVYTFMSTRIRKMKEERKGLAKDTVPLKRPFWRLALEPNRVLFHQITSFS